MNRVEVTVQQRWCKNSHVTRGCDGADEERGPAREKGRKVSTRCTLSSELHVPVLSRRAQWIQPQAAAHYLADSRS